MNPLVKVLVASLEPAAAHFLAGQLTAGSTLNVAIDNTIAALTDVIPIASLRAPAQEYLESLVPAIEQLGLSALGGTAAAAPAAASPTTSA